MRNLPGAKYRVKFNAPFKDGSIFGSELFKLNQIAEITPDQAEQARRSGAQFDILDTVLPLNQAVISTLVDPAPAPEPESDPEPAPLPRRGRPKKAGKDEQA